MQAVAAQSDPVVDGGAPKLVAIEITVAGGILVVSARDVDLGLHLFLGSPLKASPGRLWRAWPLKCGLGGSDVQAAFSPLVLWRREAMRLKRSRPRPDTIVGVQAGAWRERNGRLMTSGVSSHKGRPMPRERLPARGSVVRGRAGRRNCARRGGRSLRGMLRCSAGQSCYMLRAADP